MKKQIANLITAVRIVCSIGMLFCPAFSNWFYGLYLLGGLTDMIDGTIARKTDSVSEFGTKLDTAADLSFILVSFLKILPRIQMSIWLWGWIFVIGVVKTGNHLWFWMYDIQSAHTAANKLTGFCLFCLPLTFPFLDLQYSAPVVCVLATFTVIRETFLRRKALR